MTKQILLIAYPQGLGRYEFFASRLDQALGGTNFAEVFTLDDSRGFCTRRFGSGVVNIESRELSPNDQRSLVQGSTHAVFFWNGRDFSTYLHLALYYKLRVRICAIQTTQVVNRDRGEGFDVYIGRKGPWGNPFPIGTEGDRTEVIEKYRDYFHNKLLADETTRKALLALRGLTLGCHCKPYPCHGDIIAEYLNTLEIDDDACRSHELPKPNENVQTVLGLH